MATIDARETAYRKLDARLRAYGLDKISVRHRIAEALVAEAEKLPTDKPLELHASQVFNQHQKSIVDAIRIHANLADNAQGEAQAILILQQTDLSEIWHAEISDAAKIETLLKQQALPPAIITGPQLTRSVLGAPQIDFGTINTTTNNTLAMLNRWPKIRIAGFISILLALTAFIVFTAR